MKRPYKYRVWNGREMVSPDYIDREGFAHWKEDSVQCQSQKISQFIGITDKNKRELYDGDIIKGAHGIVHVIEYRSSLNTQYGHGDSTTKLYLGYIFHFYGSEVEELEVIGNIYANPELIPA